MILLVIKIIQFLNKVPAKNKVLAKTHPLASITSSLPVAALLGQILLTSLITSCAPDAGNRMGVGGGNTGNVGVDGGRQNSCSTQISLDPNCHTGSTTAGNSTGGSTTSGSSNGATDGESSGNFVPAIDVTRSTEANCAKLTKIKLSWPAASSNTGNTTTYTVKILRPNTTNPYALNNISLTSIELPIPNGNGLFNDPGDYDVEVLAQNTVIAKSTVTIAAQERQDCSNLDLKFKWYTNGVLKKSHAIKIEVTPNATAIQKYDITITLDNNEVIHLNNQTSYQDTLNNNYFNELSLEYTLINKTGITPKIMQVFTKNAACSTYGPTALTFPIESSFEVTNNSNQALQSVYLLNLLTDVFENNQDGLSNLKINCNLVPSINPNRVECNTGGFMLAAIHDFDNSWKCAAKTANFSFIKYNSSSTSGSPGITGCKDETATNYNATATVAGNCTYAYCDDPSSPHYDEFLYHSIVDVCTKKDAQNVDISACGKAKAALKATGCCTPTPSSTCNVP